jgi:hypothetical protein
VAPRFRIPDWPDGEYELKVLADTAGGLEAVTRTVKLKRSWKVMVSTDEPVYQPGQTIQLRSLALGRPDRKPAAGKVAVDDIVNAAATVTNSGTSSAPMVVVDLPIPAGFDPMLADLDALVAS